MADFSLTGDYASVKASAQKAYETALANIAGTRNATMQRYGYNPDGSLSGNKYGSFQQIQKSYDDQTAALARDTSDFESQMGVKINGGGYTEAGTDGALARTRADHNTLLGRIADARTKAQYDAGLNANFDGNANPTSLTLGGTNRHGGFQQLLGQQAQDLAATEENSQARGMGKRGLGGQATSDLAFQDEGQTESFKSGLMDTLKNQARGEQDENTSFTRNMADMNKSISDTIAQFTRSGADLKYNKGLDEYNLGLSLADKNADFDSQALGAEYDHNGTNSLLDEILNRIKNGDYTGTGDPAADGIGNSPVDPSLKHWDTSAMREASTRPERPTPAQQAQRTLPQLAKKKVK